MSGTQTFPNVCSYNNHSYAAPPLSIMQYFFGYSSADATKSDPDGWIICNGVTRTVTDGRFSIIAPLLNMVMNVNTNNANSITPPDLTGKFLMGASSTSTINNIGGNSSVTLSTANLPAHNHTATDNGHTHANTLTDPGHSHGTSNPFCFNGGGGGNGVSFGGSYTNNTPLSIMKNYTGVTINNAGASASITVGNTGSGTAFTTLPPYLTINYIMKY